MLHQNIELGINDLFTRFFKTMITSKLVNGSIFFAHNLGSFDGYLIYKYLLNNLDPSNFDAIVDQHHKFIEISCKIEGYKFIFKDSLRIFPVSLNEFCKIFGVEGKVSSYNPNWNNVGFLNDPIELEQFKNYSIGDSIALLEALKSAQLEYLVKYSVDICSIWSTSTLSLKIFRQKFLKKDIPILTKSCDSFVRRGYYGGATDYYHLQGENLYYYDVNSLYPYAMLNPMPLKIIKFHHDLSNVDLNNFFGFCLVKATCPIDIPIPLLPFRDKAGSLIFPTGTFTSVQFSEELKACLKHGYKFELISGYEFEKSELFNEYIDHFYDIKKNSVGSSRFIAKMHLNQLYGYFGRKLDVIETKVVDNEDLLYYFKTRLIE